MKIILNRSFTKFYDTSYNIIKIKLTKMRYKSLVYFFIIYLEIIQTGSRYIQTFEVRNKLMQLSFPNELSLSAFVVRNASIQHSSCNSLFKNIMYIAIRDWTLSKQKCFEFRRKPRDIHHINCCIFIFMWAEICEIRKNIQDQFHSRRVLNHSSEIFVSVL